MTDALAFLTGAGLGSEKEESKLLQKQRGGREEEKERSKIRKER